MHPRNRYNKRPDFGELADFHPPLKPFLIRTSKTTPTSEMHPLSHSTPPSSGEHNAPKESISSSEHLKMVETPSTKLPPGQQTLSPNKQRKFAYTLDFSKPEALRELTYAVLKRDFNLDVHLPLDKLIPAVPQRLNYIHWIEDLVKLCEECEGGGSVAVSSETEGCGGVEATQVRPEAGDIIGIDIG